MTKLLLLLSLPILAAADIPSDMQDPGLSLVEVIQNARDTGMSIGSVVTEMIESDPSQSKSIVATAMVVAPQEYKKIISSAITAGADPADVVAVALVVADGNNASNIIVAAVGAAPKSARQSIIDASVRALPETAKGVAAVQATPTTIDDKDPFDNRNPFTGRIGKSYLKTTVLFATNRSCEDLQPNFFVRFFIREPRKNRGPICSSGRGDLIFGDATVSIPAAHSRGQLESPSLWTLYTEDPAIHFVILDVDIREKERFFMTLADLFSEADEKDIFVFVHGFNTSFDEALRRTAQLAYDLDFRGVPIAYSWPSGNGKIKSPISLTRNYMTAENNVAFAEADFRRFLIMLRQAHPISDIHLLAHSMGNRVLARALQRATTQFEAPFFNQLILAAPDIDADVFERDISPILGAVARRTTIYVSTRDNALLVSSAAHGGYQRVGLVTDSDPVVVSTGDTVHTSNIDTSLLGHSYYGQIRAVLTDIESLLDTGAAPIDRSLRQRTTDQGKTYWVFPK